MTPEELDRAVEAALADAPDEETEHVQELRRALGRYVFYSYVDALR